MCDYKHIKSDIKDENRMNLEAIRTHMYVISIHFKEDLLEGELFNSGVRHQVEGDFEDFSRLQGLLW